MLLVGDFFVVVVFGGFFGFFKFLIFQKILCSSPVNTIKVLYSQAQELAAIHLDPGVKIISYL